MSGLGQRARYIDEEKQRMPTYDYQCGACGVQYDVFHKVHEVIEDVVCPSCGSENHTRLISAPAVTHGKQQDFAPPEGCCGGGMCGRN